VLRGERTRTAIVDALLDLLNDGVVDPTSQLIADRAGVSVRSVFQHFEDMESLYADMARAQGDRTRELFETLVDSGSLVERIDQLGVQRSLLFEHIAPVRNSLGTRVRTSPALRRRLDETGALLRAQVERQFAEEFGHLEQPAATGRRSVIETLDLLWSFESWERLRSEQELSVDEAAATLRAATLRLLR